MSRVAVIGHFGIGLDLANGQTIKTKIVTDAIEKKIDEKAYIVDAHGGVKAIIPVVVGCIKALKKCDNVILMLTENGLKVSVPVLSFFNLILKKRLHYIVIGGWLSKFLKTQPGLEKKLKKFNQIYVETNTMKHELEECGFTNITVLKNCKKLSILKTEDLVYQSSRPLKICTFSRVMEEKGIEDVVDVVNLMNKQKRSYVLDIYGQVDEYQSEWFERLKVKFSENIKYCGVVEFSKSVEVLKNYYMLIFPTRFYTEGIPGTIIDGYAAGVPVLSAKWERFRDVVDEGKTGIGYEINNTEALKNALEYCAINVENINDMKINCLQKSKEFTVSNAMKVLFENL